MLDISGRTQRHAPTGINNYFNGDTSREVGIHTNWLRARGPLRDLRPAGRRRRVFFKVLVKPLVNLIWIAGIVFLFGSLVALWPDAREQRRLDRAARAQREHDRARPGRADRGRRGPPRRAAVPPSRTARRRLLDAPTDAEEQRLLLIEERDHALARAQGARVRPPHGQGRRRRLPRARSAPLRRAAADALRALDASGAPQRAGRPPPRSSRRSTTADSPVTKLPLVTRLRGRRRAICSCLLVVGAVAAPALADDITGKKHAVDQQIDALSSQLAAQQAERGGAAQRDRRRHGAHPHARGERRRRLAPARDARAGPRAAPRAPREAEQALQAPVDAARRGCATQYEVAVERLDERLVSIYSRRRADDARVRVRRDLDRRRARQGRLHARIAREDQADRAPRSRTRSRSMQQARKRTKQVAPAGVAAQRR